MKALVTLLSLLGAVSSVTACATYVEDETGTDQASLRGVEPDEIDYDGNGHTVIKRGTGSSAPAPGVEPDEIGYDDDGTATPGVEPDEIDYDGREDPQETRGVEPDEIDVYNSAHAAAASQGTKGKLVTYGPVITIKPKG